MQDRFAIHQPNFFPWLGYFDRIAQVDAFIFFDHVAMPGGRTIVQRVRVLGPQGETWLTMPIQKSGKLGQRICEVLMREPEASFLSMIEKLSSYYRRAPFFGETLSFLETLTPTTDLLALYNRRVIEAISCKLGLKTRFFASSTSTDLMGSDAVRTEMILQTCEAFEIKEYLSGKGCLDFLEVDAFRQHEISLQFQEFVHPEYPQKNGNFCSGLSILDAFFNIGIEGTRELLSLPLLAHSS